DYIAPLTPHDTGSEKSEPGGVPEFGNGSMHLNLPVAERSPASICTRRCTAQSVRRISCVSGRSTTWFEMRENPPPRLGRLKARGFLRGDGGETGAGTHDPVDPRPPMVLGHRPPRRAERHRLLLSRGLARHRPPASRAYRRGTRPRWDRGLRGPLPLGTSSTKRDVRAARNLLVRIGVPVVALPVIPLQLVAVCVPALASRPTDDEVTGPEEGDRDQGEEEGQGLGRNGERE